MGCGSELQPLAFPPAQNPDLRSMGTRSDVSTFRVAFRASWSPEARFPVSPEVQYSFKLGFALVRDWICIRQQLFDWAANWIPPAICSLMGVS